MSKPNGLFFAVSKLRFETKFVYLFYHSTKLCSCKKSPLPPKKLSF